MELYIRIKDGKPFEHPILGDNFRQAFPNIDTENLPPEFARFVRVDRPKLNAFEVYVDCTYELVNGIWTDVHQIRAMTAEERTVVETRNAVLALPAMPTTGGPWRFDRITNDWVIATEPPFPSWVIRADGLRYVPPIPRPEGQYRWDEATLSWVAFNV